ncbi:MAG: zinc ribbon domain-containing protein [Geobacter sp.]|nr:zinc ribbon domain-containing protein [Geobacter sp.]
MSLATQIKAKLLDAKNSLTSLDKQPLSKATLVILLFLDIFILTAIFNGLSAHTRQLSTPQEYIPSSCRQMVIDRTWNPTNRIENLSQLVDSYTNSYTYRPQPIARERHPACTSYLTLLDQIKNDKTLTSSFDERQKAEREAQELQRRIDQLKGSYDTSLLEAIAQQPEPATEIDATKAEFKQKSSRLNSLKSQITALDELINNNPTVAALWLRLQSSQASDRQALLAELRTLNFWYPVKRFGMQMLFLLPLFAIFYAWNNASIKHSRGLQILVSSHLLGVSFIPIFCKLIEAIYDIIPKQLLHKLISLLTALKLVAIWHYLIIGLAIGAALFLIYIFQKKLFSREKLIERRIAKGECQQCGKHLPAESTACPFCGYVQFKPCSSCGLPTHLHGKYCRECGAKHETGY